MRRKLMTRKPIAATLVASGLLILVAAPALAEETRCTGTIAAAALDNIRVPDRATCVLTATRAKGSIVVGRGATLRAQRVQIEGNVQAEGALRVTLGAGSQIGGSVQLGQGERVRVEDARIKGDLQLSANRGPMRLVDNRIGGNLQVVGNRGPLLVGDNVIDGKLECKENRPGPDGGGNQASSKEDQCAGL
jgi:hypothetical protein